MAPSEIPESLLFAYGTLRPGLAPASIADVVDRFRSVGPGRVPGRLYDLGPHPGAVFDEGSDAVVVGEVLAIPGDPATLDRLDDYEGFLADDPDRSFFVRLRVVVRRPDGTSVGAWAYQFGGAVSGLTPVPGGDYDAFLGGRPRP